MIGLWLLGRHSTGLYRILTDRCQRIKLGDCLSSKADLKFGVPQGSVLGPLLFTLYTTPLSSMICEHAIPHHLYADDSQLYVSFASGNSAGALNGLQSCLISVNGKESLKPCEVNVSNTIQKWIAIIEPTRHKSSSKHFCTIQIKVTTDTPQIPHMVKAWATDYRNMWAEGEIFIKYYTEITSRFTRVSFDTEKLNWKYGGVFAPMSFVPNNYGNVSGVDQDKTALAWIQGLLQHTATQATPSWPLIADVMSTSAFHICDKIHSCMVRSRLQPTCGEGF